MSRTTIATRVHGGKADPSWITPNDVGRHIIALMASENAAHEDRASAQPRRGG